MIRTLFALTVLAYSALPAAADEHEATFVFAGDAFAAGQTVTIGAADDVFAAGERVTLTGPAAGSAHLAGRALRVDGAVGGDLYAAGYALETAAEVTGDLTAASYSVRLGAALGGDLRATASEVEILAPVAGAVLIAAEHVRIEAPISGDVRLAVRGAEFGPDARIDGRLTLLSDNDIAVPAHVIPEDRITRLPAEKWEGPGVVDLAALLLWAALSGLVLGAIALALLLAVARDWAERVCEEAAGRPFRSVALGFVALAALIGAVPLAGITLIGIPLTPFLAIFAWLAAISGWILGAYALGIGLWSLTGRPSPLSYAGDVGVAWLGLVVLVVVGLIPVLGWMVCVAVVLMGVGALAREVLGARL